MRYSMLLAAGLSLGAAIVLVPEVATAQGKAVVRRPVSRTAALLAPEPLLIRINGTKALTERVFPVMAEKSGQLTREVSRIDVANYSATVMGFGGTVESWVSNLRLRVPVEADDLHATFKNAPANKARLDTEYDFNRASLKLEFHVKSQAKTPLDAIAPPFVKRMLQLNDTFYIELKGVSGDLNMTLARSGNGVVVEKVDRFTAQLGTVSVTDSGVLTEIANALLGFDKLFNVVGASNVDQAAKKLVNKLLTLDLGLENRIRTIANNAIKTIDTQKFANQNLALGPGSRMNVAATFSSLASQVNQTRSQFDLALAGVPANGAPGLSFSTPRRPVEDLLYPGSAGDVEAFIPYSLIDKAMFEAIRAGLFKSFDVPAQGGLTQAFRMKLTPTQVPHANRDPNSTRKVKLTFAAKMENATVGSVRIGAGTPLQRNISISTVDATATVGIFCEVKSDATSGVYLTIDSVQLENLAGQLKVGAVTTNLAPHRALLQSVLTSTMPGGLPRLTLMSQTMALVAPLKVQVGNPFLGTQYVRVPLSIVVD